MVKVPMSDDGGGAVSGGDGFERYGLRGRIGASGVGRDFGGSVGVFGVDLSLLYVRDLCKTFNRAMIRL